MKYITYAYIRLSYPR